MIVDEWHVHNTPETLHAVIQLEAGIFIMQLFVWAWGSNRQVFYMRNLYLDI